MRVIVACLEPPTRTGGAGTRWYDVLIRGLLARGHDVSVLAASSSEERLSQARADYTDIDFHGFLAPRPGPLERKRRTLARPYSYAFSGEFEHALREEARRGFDVLHAEQLWTGWPALPYRERTLLNIHYLRSIDMRNAPRSGPRAFAEYGLTALAERRLLPRFPHLRALTDRLATEASRRGSAAPDVVHFGIDTSIYPFLPPDSLPDAPVAGFVGDMRWYPNIETARRLIDRIWPRVRAQLPGARLRISGWNARAALGEGNPGHGVLIQQDVADIGAEFARLRLLVAPVENGTGTKTKVIEGLLRGIPVLTTPTGLEGFHDVPTTSVAYRGTDEALAEEAVRLLQAPAEELHARRSKGRAIVEDQCSPERTVGAIEAIHRRIAQANGE